VIAEGSHHITIVSTVRTVSFLLNLYSSNVRLIIRRGGWITFIIEVVLWEVLLDGHAIKSSINA
jgi:hypothetical protein